MKYERDVSVELEKLTRRVILFCRKLELIFYQKGESIL